MREYRARQKQKLTSVKRKDGIVTTSALTLGQFLREDMEFDYMPLMSSLNWPVYARPWKKQENHCIFQGTWLLCRHTFTCIGYTEVLSLSDTFVIWCILCVSRSFCSSACGESNLDSNVSPDFIPSYLAEASYAENFCFVCVRESLTGDCYLGYDFMMTSRVFREEQLLL